MNVRIAITTCCILFFTGALPRAATRQLTDYERSIETWHEGRIERLTSENGYLALVGLFPLREGINRFGSSADNDMVFPDRAPQQAGVFVLSGDGTVKIAVEPGVAILHDGEVVQAMEVKSDHQEDTTEFDMGTFHFYVIERDGRLYLRLKDTESPTLKRFRGIERYPVDPVWRVDARFEKYETPRTILVPDILGYDIETEVDGAVVFEIEGSEYRLEPLDADEESMFIVFADKTSGVSTYGGGRFVYVDAPDAEGHVVIDFNKAYNPPCAFTRYATCPLPHAANVLPIAITAGEMNYHDGSH